MSRLPRLLTWALALALLGAGLAACGDDDEGAGIPTDTGTEVPDAYRIVYEVITPDSTGQEERIVHRPFEAHVVERDAEGATTAERWSTLGQLVTRSQGGEVVRIDTAVAPSASDVRPDRFAARLLEAGKLTAGTPGRIGERPCTRVKDAGAVLTAPPAGSDQAGGSLPVLVERCIDEQGLVLEERWTTAGGERVLTKRAIELEVGEDAPDIVVPDADPLPLEQGNGAVRELDADEVPPFAEVWSLPAPAGFGFVGRYAVQPPRLSQAALTSDPDVALYTDVWERGGDLLLLDQGASQSGATPFDPASALGPVDVPGIGAAELAVDLRLAEVRFARPDGGFVRLAGTVPLDELLRLAATLQHTAAVAP